MDCMLCGKKLVNEDFRYCDSCMSFLIWKYDSLDNFERVHREVIKKAITEINTKCLIILNSFILTPRLFENHQ